MEDIVNIVKKAIDIKKNNLSNGVNNVVSNKVKEIEYEKFDFDNYMKQVNELKKDNKTYEFDDYVKLNDIKYSDKTDCSYNLYLPPDYKNKDNKLVLFIHGGSFMTGSKDFEGEKMYWDYYISKGYVVATIDYPLIKDGAKDNFSLDGMCDEIEKGVNNIYDKAKSNGCNVDGMIVEGFSAGGTLAMIYGANNAKNSPIPVKCIVNLSGPSTMDPNNFSDELLNDGVHSREEMVASLSSNLTGKKINVDMVKSGEYKKFTDTISPNKLLDKTEIPIISAYPTDNDVFNPTNIMEEFTSQTKTSNPDNINYIFENSNHSLEGNDSLLKELFEKSEEYINK